MNILLIGAHPDDCEINAGGTAAKWRAADFDVTLVSMTNGDAGHHSMPAKALATRRKRESRAAAKIIGARSVVLDNRDGQLTASLAVRRQVVGLIRKYKADVVITHRPNDYHPDHRYTAQAVQDAAYMVTVQKILPRVPALRKNPVFMYFMDRFERPVPFRPDVAVAVDDVMETKWRMLDAMESQFYEWLAWHAGSIDDVPAKPKERLAWFKKTWSPNLRPAATKDRTALKTWYGPKAAAKVKFAELFEVSEYGRQPSDAEIREIFPFLPRGASKK